MADGANAGYHQRSVERKSTRRNKNTKSPSFTNLKCPRKATHWTGANFNFYSKLLTLTPIRSSYFLVVLLFTRIPKSCSEGWHEFGLHSFMHTHPAQQENSNAESHRNSWKSITLLQVHVFGSSRTHAAQGWRKDKHETYKSKSVHWATLTKEPL